MTSLFTRLHEADAARGLTAAPATIIKDLLDIVGNSSKPFCYKDI